ncbi:MAG: hypothetical protein EZS28_005460 [Streblomastix strix]|uniref:Uncharacterized protein n=1 Tax=Streblomastix strix TaxID=222440 RepID=A0A5J4WWX7_9EUKA|nr:MAG: hypothetical protein EZS28_005460 [Streblomastix strix]
MTAPDERARVLQLLGRGGNIAPAKPKIVETEETQLAKRRAQLIVQSGMSPQEADSLLALEMQRKKNQQRTKKSVEEDEYGSFSDKPEQKNKKQTSVTNSDADLLQKGIEMFQQGDKNKQSDNQQSNRYDEQEDDDDDNNNISGREKKLLFMKEFDVENNNDALSDEEDEFYNRAGNSNRTISFTEEASGVAVQLDIFQEEKKNLSLKLDQFKEENKHQKISMIKDQQNQDQILDDEDIDPLDAFMGKVNIHLQENEEQKIENQIRIVDSEIERLTKLQITLEEKEKQQKIEDEKQQESLESSRTKRNRKRKQKEKEKAKQAKSEKKEQKDQNNEKLLKNKENNLQQQQYQQEEEEEEDQQDEDIQIIENSEWRKHNEQAALQNPTSLRAALLAQQQQQLSSSQQTTDQSNNDTNNNSSTNAIPIVRSKLQSEGRVVLGRETTHTKAVIWDEREQRIKTFSDLIRETENNETKGNSNNNNNNNSYDNNNNQKGNSLNQKNKAVSQQNDKNQQENKLSKKQRKKMQQQRLVLSDAQIVQKMSNFTDLEEKEGKQDEQEQEQENNEIDEFVGKVKRKRDVENNEYSFQIEDNNNEGNEQVNKNKSDDEDSSYGGFIIPTIVPQFLKNKAMIKFNFGVKSANADSSDKVKPEMNFNQRKRARRDEEQEGDTNYEDATVGQKNP